MATSSRSVNKKSDLWGSPGVRTGHAAIRCENSLLRWHVRLCHLLGVIMTSLGVQLELAQAPHEQARYVTEVVLGPELDVLGARQ
jgi:hypothetical protein